MASYNIFKTDTQAARFLGQGKPNFKTDIQAARFFGQGKPNFKTDTRAARFMGINLLAHPASVSRDEAKYARGTQVSGHAMYSPQVSPPFYYWS